MTTRAEEIPPKPKQTSAEPKEGPSDLTGDPVYDHLKQYVLDDFELLGGEIIVRKSVGPRQPRKIIKVYLLNTKTKRPSEETYGYNRVLKGI